MPRYKITAMRVTGFTNNYPATSALGTLKYIETWAQGDMPSIETVHIDGIKILKETYKLQLLIMGIR